MAEKRGRRNGREDPWSLRVTPRALGSADGDEPPEQDTTKAFRAMPHRGFHAEATVSCPGPRESSPEGALRTKLRPNDGMKGQPVFR